MTCEAFKHGQLNRLRACRDCGQPYWVHSHEAIPAPGHPATRPRTRHVIISTSAATGVWTRHAIMPNTIWQVPADPIPDMRPRYQIMQERHVSISKFVAATMIKARVRRQWTDAAAAAAHLDTSYHFNYYLPRPAQGGPVTISDLTA